MTASLDALFDPGSVAVVGITSTGTSAVEERELAELVKANGRGCSAPTAWASSLGNQRDCPRCADGVQDRLCRVRTWQESG